MTALSEALRPEVAGPASELQARRITPVKWWAWIGAAFLSFELYLFAAWLSSGQFRPTPSGPTPVPARMKWTIHGYEAIGLVFAAVFVYYFLIRPWRREGHITLDGLLTLVFLSLYWQDLMLNYFQPWVIYNAEAINFGSWFGNVPGWNWPNGNLMVEPFVWVFPVYAYIMFGIPVLGCVIMRKAKQRWPQLGKFGLAMVCFGVFVLVDLVLEPGMMLLGLFHYGGSIKWLTLFHGHYYQFPIYEAFWFPFILTVWACLRYYRNDKGQILAEHGIETLRVSRRQRTAIRFLALAGVFNVTFLFLYSGPMAVIHVKADAWPQDIQNRSYFTNELCGPGTSYACPGPGIPIPRPDSAHLTPYGTLVVPKGTKTPGR